jgi:hypothetical protein
MISGTASRLHVAWVVYRKVPISIHISQNLINNLFSYPYTRIEFVQHDLKVSRLTATRYLEALTTAGFLHKRKIGRSNYYINLPLYRILTGEALPVGHGMGVNGLTNTPAFIDFYFYGDKLSIS